MERADIPIDIDLGELIEGHHVIARKLVFSTDGTSLDFVYEPALSQDEMNGMAWYWVLDASDDLGTEYRDWNGGAFGPSEDGKATLGHRDVGGVVPAEASWLLLRFEPPGDWRPPVPWTSEIRIDLREEGDEGPRWTSMLIRELTERSSKGDGGREDVRGE